MLGDAIGGVVVLQDRFLSRFTGGFARGRVIGGCDNIDRLIVSVDHVALMTMVEIHDHIPPRPSGQHISVLLGVGIEPMEVLVRVAVATTFMVLMSGSFYPCIIKIGWFVLVSVVGILVTMFVTML